MNQNEVSLVFKPQEKNCVGCVFYHSSGCQPSETVFPCCTDDREDKKNGIWIIEDFDRIKSERDELKKRLDGYLETFPRVQEQRNAFERKCDDLSEQLGRAESVIAEVARSSTSNRLRKIAKDWITK